MPELPDDLVLPSGFLPDPPLPTVAVPRDAATVMLLRDTKRGMEVFCCAECQAWRLPAG